MKRIGVLVALFACATRPAWASPPAEQDAAAALVQSQLVRPATERESRRSRFSRARPAPTARRVRILDETPLKDEKNAAFVRFAIDTRRGFFEAGEEDGWTADDQLGCVYLERKQVFVRVGARHYPAEFLLGKRVDAADANVCQAAAAVAATAQR